MRFMVTNSDSSATHGPHQVAHRFTNSNLSARLRTSSATPRSSIGLSVTSSAFHLASDLRASSRLSDHFVEQPNTRVFSTGTGLPAKQRVDGVAGIVRLDLLYFRVVDAAHVAQLPLAVEDEHVRRGQHSVRGRRFLRLAVVKIRKREFLVLGPDLHVLQRIAQVGVSQLVESHRRGVVGRNRHHRHAAVLVVGVQL